MRKLIYILLLCATGTAVYGQNLSPTIEVSREFRGKLAEASKPLMEMSVPDSVNRFDLDFDYEVFDKPYSSAYVFSPFVLAMRPEDTADRGKTFYLNAGIGYSLHPVFDLVWEPRMKKTKGKYAMSVYAKHRSFIGKYRSFDHDMDASEIVRLTSMHPFGEYSKKGYDAYTNVGTNGRVDYSGGVFGYDIGYVGIHRDADLFNAVDAKFHVNSTPKNERSFVYDIRADYRYLNDIYAFDKSSLDGHELQFDISLGGDIRHTHNVLVDFNVDYVNYSHASDIYSAGSYTVVPHYIFIHGPWHVNAGLKLSFTTSNNRSMVYHAKNQIAYPDVSVSLAAIREAMSIYAAVTGGNNIYTYSSLLERDHRFNNTFFRMGRDYSCWIDTEIERVNVSLGIKGRIANCFSYNLRGGYALYGNTLFDGIAAKVGSEGKEELAAMFGYTASQKAYVSLDWKLGLEMFEFSGKLDYSHFWSLGSPTDMAGLFVPAALTGEVSLMYNWKKRVYAGIDCVFATARKGNVLRNDGVKDAVIPGFADLGVSMEYRIDRKLSVWLRGGNLLNMDVQYNPLRAESGISGTVGVRLNF